MHYIWTSFEIAQECQAALKIENNKTWGGGAACVRTDRHCSTNWGHQLCRLQSFFRRKQCPHPLSPPSIPLAHLSVAPFVFTAQNKWLMLHSTSLHIINTGNKSPLSLLIPTQHTPDPPLLTATVTWFVQLTVSLSNCYVESTDSLKLVILKLQRLSCDAFKSSLNSFIKVFLCQEHSYGWL